MGNQDQKHAKDKVDIETAQEIVSHPNDHIFSRQESSSDERNSDHREATDRGYGWGIAGIALSVLSFFLWPYLLAPLGIVLGVVSVSQKSSVGWWAIVVGVIALILVTIFTIIAVPFRILF